MVAALLVHVAAVTVAAGHGARVVPCATLSNGFELPLVGLGMGPWCNTPKCPAPAKPCADCYDNASAAADVILAASVGITLIDTALGYGNQGGVGDAVRRFPGGREHAVVQTKVPPCGGTTAPYSNFDIILEPFLAHSQLQTHPHCPCTVLSVLPMLIGS